MTDNYLHFLLKSQEFIHTDSSITSSLRLQNIKKCRELQKLKQVDLPPKFFSNTVRCKFCGTEWSLGSFHARITHSKYPGRKMKKIIQKGQISLDSLNKFERGLFRKYQQNQGNVLGLRCLICKKKTFIKLHKPSYAKVSKEVAENRDNEKSVKTQNIKKRKKKKKNSKFSDTLLPLSNVKKSSKRSGKNKTEKQEVLLLSEDTLPSTVESSGPYILKKKSKQKEIQLGPKTDNRNPVNSGRVKKRGRNLGKLHALIAEEAKKKVSKNSLADFMTFLST